MPHQKSAIIAFCLIIGGCLNAVAQQKENKGSSLSSKQQNMISIASLTAKGDLARLKVAFKLGLEAGLTVNQIKETLVHVYAYCGFPRSILGLQTFIAVLDERKAKGIEDDWGAEASPITSTRSKYDRGKEILEELTQTKLDGKKPAYQQFSPEIDVFLKEHLFADIFERNVLTFQERELITVSVLIAIGNVEPMLRSHITICLKQGITPTQLRQLIETTKPSASHKKLKSAQKVLLEIGNN